MTAVDHAELKRLAEGATPGEWRVSEDNNPFADGRHVFAKGLDGTDFVVLNLKTDHTFVTATSRVQQQRNAKFSAAAYPAVVIALLSEIEGLKAERDAYRDAAHLESVDCDAAEAALRIQAPDSWRPIETAPKDGTWVQAWRDPPSFTGPRWEPLIYVRWDDAEESWIWPCDTFEVFTVRGRELADMAIDEGDFYSSPDFAHWMPLPSAPALRPQTAESGK